MGLTMCDVQSIVRDRSYVSFASMYGGMNEHSSNASPKGGSDLRRRILTADGKLTSQHDQLGKSGSRIARFHNHAVNLVHQSTHGVPALQRLGRGLQGGGGERWVSSDGGWQFDDQYSTADHPNKPGHHFWRQCGDFLRSRPGHLPEHNSSR
jgi:hypothetical protein